MCRRVSATILLKRYFLVRLLTTSSLDIRTKLVQRPTGKEQRLTFPRSMQDFLEDQNIWIAIVSSHLEDIRNLLAVVEAAMEMVTKEGENDTREGNTTKRTLRSQK
jgi:hypothetical protein